MRLIKKAKKLAALVTVTAVMMLSILGCEMEEATGDKLKDIDFTVVGEDQQPEALKDIIAERSAEPFQISYTIGEDLYIAIGYGEQPSGGYSISINEFYEADDTLIIDTTLIGPGKAENVTNTPTKPYIVIKTENIDGKTIQFK